MAPAARRAIWLLVVLGTTGLAFLAARGVNHRVAGWLAVPAGEGTGGPRKGVASKPRPTPNKPGTKPSAGAAPQQPVVPTQGFPGEKAPGQPEPGPAMADEGGQAPRPMPGPAGLPSLPGAPPFPPPEDGVAAAEPGEEAGLPDAGMLPEAPEDEEAPAPTGLQAYLVPILDRSLFNHEAMHSQAAGGDTEGGEPAMAQADLQASLLGTIVSSDARYSTALLKVGATGPSVYYIGDKIEDATVDLIERKRIEVVRGNGERQEIALGAATASAARDTEPQDGAPARPGQHDWAGIKDLGSNHFEIQRAELEYAMANLDSMSRDARVVPSGQGQGMKVFAIKRNSVFRKLGVKNNDVLMSVNGQALTADKALELYSKLSSSKTLTLDIQRRGEPITLTYDIK